MKRYISLALLILVVALSYGQSTEPGGLDTTSSNQYIVIDISPSFPGGDKKRIKFLSKNLEYPNGEKKIYEGYKVVVSFIIDTTGKLSDFAIVDGLSAELDSAAIGVARKMPDWSPAYSKGKKIKCQMVLPIKF